MPLIYITGISGSGKSAVRHELQTRAYEAHDVDQDGFRSWYNKALDTRATEQKGWNDTTVEWRNLYWLKIDRSKVEELATRAKKQSTLIFLCGVTPNDKDVWDLFDKVIALSIGEKTLRHRLATRQSNDYGKHPDDLRDIIGWNKDFSKRRAAA
jgi:broad-specificity NMP kinase